MQEQAGYIISVLGPVPTITGVQCHMVWKYGCPYFKRDVDKLDRVH